MALTVLALLAASIPGLGLLPGPLCGTGDTAEACTSWTARHAPETGLFEEGEAVAATPDGATVVAVGTAPRTGTGDDMVAIGYDAATGETLWTTHYDGDGLTDRAVDVAVGPAGVRAYVTGVSETGFSGEDVLTFAVDVTSGDVLWTNRYNGPVVAGATTHAVDVDRAGDRVFAVGATPGDGTGDDGVIVAYDAASGVRRWVERLDVEGGSDEIVDVAANPASSRVHVAATTSGPGLGRDLTVRTFGVAGGDVLWTSHYDELAYDVAEAIAVSPGGEHVVALAESHGGLPTRTDYLTLSLAADDGAREWTARYNGPEDDFDHPVDIATDGETVVATGWTWHSVTSWDYTTVAFDAATGQQSWVSRYDGIASEAAAGKVLNDQDDANVGSWDFPTGLALDAETGRLVVTGYGPGYNAVTSPGQDYAHDVQTVAYDLATGGQVWSARYNHRLATSGCTEPGNPGCSYDVGEDVALAGDRIVVTGTSHGGIGEGWDVLTLAYPLPGA